MKVVMKHIILPLFIVVYSLFIFGPSVEIVSVGQHEKTEFTGEGYYLTEISKVLFPQTVNTGLAFVTAIHIGKQTPDYIEKSFLAIQELSKRLLREDINHLKESIQIDLKYRSQDIIYPFHNFW